MHVAVALSDADNYLGHQVTSLACDAYDDVRMLSRHGASSILRQQALLNTKMHTSAHVCSNQ